MHGLVFVDRPSGRGGTIIFEIVARWHAEHANYSRLLDVLERQLVAFQDDELPDFELMGSIVAYLREFPDRYHHPREDVAYERLLERDPQLRLPINRLLQEHRAIAAAGDHLLSRLSDAAAGLLVNRAAVESAVALYTAYFRHHLATEERVILPRAVRLLTAEDWSVIDRSVPEALDPLFGDTPDEQYRSLREHLSALAGRSDRPA